MHRWIASSIALAFCVNVVACAANSPSTYPVAAPTFAQDDITQVALPDGRVGVWIEEKAFGDVLAGVEWEKGEEQKRTQQQRMRAEIAEQNVVQLQQANQPAMLFLRYGVPSAVVAAAIAAIAAFFGGLAAGREVR